MHLFTIRVLSSSLRTFISTNKFNKPIFHLVSCIISVILIHFFNFFFYRKNHVVNRFSLYFYFQWIMLLHHVIDFIISVYAHVLYSQLIFSRFSIFDEILAGYYTGRSNYYMRISLRMSRYTAERELTACSIIYRSRDAIHARDTLIHSRKYMNVLSSPYLRLLFAGVRFVYLCLFVDCNSDF